jgi:arylsulfatase A-like enzyme
VRQIGFTLVLLLVIGGTLASCTGERDGWMQLRRDDWRWHHRGREWALGLDARGTRFRVDRGNAEFRSAVRNFGDGPAELQLRGPAGSRSWQLEMGGRNDLAVTLAAGEYSVDAPPGVVLGWPRIGRPRASSRLLVFILVDTLRADHVTPQLTPHIWRAFENGTRWRRATANCSWTLPSVASMFTSRPVLDLTSPEGDLIGVPDGAATWASRLEAAGFIGGAVVANYTIHALNGFSTGFASYLVPDGRAQATHPDATWVVSEARRWIAHHRGEDTFLYLHLMDPHQPYRSHSDPEITAPDLAPLALRRRTASDEERTLLQRLYADEVSHVDAVVGPFLDELPDSAIVVLTSDHGEALGEHGAWGHGLNLYQEALRVPLAISGPGVPSGKVEDPVQLLDLAPTVLNLMGVEATPGMAGRSFLDGGSAPPIVSSTFGGGPMRWSWLDGRDKVVLRMAAQGDLGAQARSAMQEGQPLPAGGFHFDLEADPGEQNPRSIPDPLMERCGQAFARSAGRMVPGLQLMVWGRRGASTVAIEVEGDIEVVQAWSGAPMTVVREGDRLEMSCPQPFPVCAAALAVDPAPPWVRPVDDTARWHGLESGSPIPIPDLELPGSTLLSPGTYLWWNQPRTLVVGGHEETIERLRALGYIE